MFIPSARTWEEMSYERAGFWPVPINKGDEYALLLKVPTNVIKAAYRSAPITLSVATASTPVGAVLATVLVIADDPSAPLGVSGVARHVEEQLALREILRLGETLFIFFDELSRPVVRARCFLEQETRRLALAQIESRREWYSGAWIPTFVEVLDEVDALVDPTNPAASKHCPVMTQVALTLTNFETNRITAIGEHEVLDFRLDDPDEGHGLEQTTWHLLEALFGSRIFHSPRIPEANGTTELTDILGLCELGHCLFEAKAIAILNTSTDRSTDRRTKNIHKQIDKGVAQLPGAMRNLAASVPLSSSSGEPISVPANTGSLRVGVIMVSELLPSVDWRAVADQLVKAATTANAPLVVLDLQELRLLVGISKSPDHLMAHLVRRFEIMVQNRSAFIRTKLDGPPMP